MVLTPKKSRGCWKSLAISYTYCASELYLTKDFVGNPVFSSPSSLHALRACMRAVVLPPLPFPFGYGHPITSPVPGCHHFCGPLKAAQVPSRTAQLTHRLGFGGDRRRWCFGLMTWGPHGPERDEVRPWQLPDTGIDEVLGGLVHP